MVKLSVNINKIATLRNSRGENTPNLIKVASDVQKFGANGITIHPRPDQRHIKFKDSYDLKKIIKTEYNIEGFPSSNFISMVLKIIPTQVTLVPDSEDAITSNSGWDTIKNKSFLTDVISQFKEKGIRTSIFLDTDLRMIDAALEIGTDRIELYTQRFSEMFKFNSKKAISPYLNAAIHAKKNGIGLNAGHDLNLDNINFFATNIPNLLEVSIGHALICESLYFGLENVIKEYLSKLK
ncbi:MAG: pyridoxine 5'-phosphate synthase [Flavobacteriaceae bacterium]|nr:pyridoxine 5'-phosphate synthase [Flavobacteriaceae bacterium]